MKQLKVEPIGSIKQLYQMMNNKTLKNVKILYLSTQKIFQSGKHFKYHGTYTKAILQSAN